MPTNVELGMFAETVARQAVQDVLAKAQLQIDPKAMTSFIMQEILIQSVKTNILLEQMAVASGLVEQEPSPTTPAIVEGV